MLKAVKKYITFALFFLLSSLLILELLFRFQAFDFYQFEFKHLNSSIKKEAKNTLFFGDSFSAYPKGYIEEIRRQLPNDNFINSAISGTGMRQHELIFSKRINTYTPDKIIYQFYVGNDFLDLYHPINIEHVGLAKSLYWKISEHLLILQYINFKLAPLNRLKEQNNKETIENQDFDSKHYNQRSKINFAASPSYIQDILFLENENQKIYERWKSGFQELINKKPKSCKVYFLMIPHCAQVNQKYLARMQAIGAKLENKVLQNTYPLYVQIQKDFPELVFINPLKELRLAEEKKYSVYFNNDPHLNHQGQMILSQVLIPKLKE